MADFEDANSPTWANQVSGQLDLRDAVDGTIEYTLRDGRHYTLNEQAGDAAHAPARTHLPEKHLRVDDGRSPARSSTWSVDLPSRPRLLDARQRAYYYLPKLEHHLEARLWNDVFTWAEDALGLPAGSIRATVLIETLPAAFQMEEILFELREHS